MAKEEREIKDVYWLRLVEVSNTGIRKELKREVSESSGKVFKLYSEWIADANSVKDKKMLVDILFISQGMFYTIREHHCWDGKECEISGKTLKI